MSKSLIRKNPSKRYPTLSVLKYDKSVFYKNLWNTNKDLLECRGHVIDEQGNVVVNSFTKIFNFGENGTTINRDTRVLFVEKMNGFMASATYVPSVDAVVIATTGSLDSDFVKYAEDYLLGDVTRYIYSKHKYDGVPPATYLFEICHPSDPHIIKEKCGAYLIGKREVNDKTAYHSSPVREDVLDEIADIMGVMRPRWGACKFGDLVAESKKVEHEGFVVYTINEEKKVALKIKSPYYLATKAIARKADIFKLDKSKVDEEYYPLIDHILEYGEKFNGFTEQQRIDIIREFLHKDDLLPCPFCGFKPNIMDRDCCYPMSREHPELLELHCYTNGGGCGATVSGSSLKECVDNWNKRV